MVRVKICGLRTRAELAVAARSGASYAGLVFHDKSPRHVTLDDAKWIVAEKPKGVQIVALTVDTDDEMLAAIRDAAGPAMFQLHGRESPERVAEIREHFDIPVMKAVGLGQVEDLDTIDNYARVADQILVDARPTGDAGLPGGNGIVFDWRLIVGYHWRLPWMLAGGLTPENVAEAIRLTGAKQVDVSSGVERKPGYKDPDKIEAFVAAATGRTA